MRLKLRDCMLYAVTDPAWLRGQTLAQQVEAALKGGVTMVQLREKDLTGAALEEEAGEILALCRRYRVPLLINDDVMLAKKIGADGVHVGQSDMAAEEARQILGPDAIIGVTARTVEQARAAEAAGADYLGSGAVFGTSTKKDAKPMDPAYFQEICESVSIPVVAIGGITLDNIRQLAGRGMSGFAIVSGIFAAEDIEAQCRQLWEAAKELCIPGAAARVEADVLRKRPVVQCITNFVTVNDCANALLAVGASPTMAHHPQEMKSFALATDALICNMGATESLDAMLLSAGMAAGMGHPVVIDPVGCATSDFRRGRCMELISLVGDVCRAGNHPEFHGKSRFCIRGNAAEIRALAEQRDTGRGVDDLSAEQDGGIPGDAVLQDAAFLARETGAVVIASGATDYVTDGIRSFAVEGGTPWMARVTGTGCMLSALLGAYLAAEPSALGAALCCARMKAAAERALEKTRAEKGGTGTFHIRLIDELSGEI